MGLRVFAVETHSAQITWSHLGPGQIRFRWDTGDASVETDGGPGSAEIDRLHPGTTHQVEVRGAGLRDVRTLTIRTLPSPPGDELYRFATISDLHLGAKGFGITGRIRESAPVVPHPLRCSAAAISELLDWGAQRLVVKGDIVHVGRPHTWAMAGDLFAGIPIPADLINGNHDVSLASTVDPRAETARLGLRLCENVEHVDVDGIRLVMMDSSVPDVDIGRWSHLRPEVCDAVAHADGPAMVLVHHQPQHFPVPTYLPRGIPSFSAIPFARAVARANPSTMGTSGHTHRHRRHNIAGLTWSEVGSPKDYPGTWAGYVVHEGGIRQVVRRVSTPDVLAWTERTKRAALGTWGMWSPGRLSDRCFNVTW